MGFIDRFNRLLGGYKDEQSGTQTTNYSDNINTISVSDLESNINRAKTSNRITPSINKHDMRDSETFIKGFLADKSGEISGSSIDAARICEILPEIDDAIGLRTASILSGNNFLKYNAKFEILDNNELDADEVPRIIEVIEEFFNKEYDLSTKLSEWLPSIFKTDGSKPVLVLPFSAINDLRNDKIQNLSSEEIVNYYSKKSVYSNISFATESFDDVIDDAINDQDLIDTVTQSLESLYINDINETIDSLENPNEAKLKKIAELKNVVPSEENLKNSMKQFLKSFDVSKRVSLIEDPLVLLANKSKQKRAVEDLNAKIANHLKTKLKVEKSKNDNIEFNDKELRELDYLEEEYIDLTEYISTDANKEDIPLIMELPSEAVIPLIVPGNPEEHLGYFIILNSYGEPISISSEDTEELLANKVSTENKLIKDMYSSVYSSNNFNLLTNKTDRDQYFTVYKDISGRYMEGLLKKHLAKIGLDTVNFSITQPTLRAMLSNILAKKRTNILFIPQTLVTYFSFKKNEYGIGVPLIKSAMFALSLKVTYLVTQMFALMEDAINRRNVSITLNKNIPNPLELMNEIRDLIVKQRVKPFSPDPDTIAYNLASSHITMKPTNIPGIEAFDITNEAAQKNSNRPDDTLIENINSMAMGNLGVPRSVYNQISSNEYATSITSNNIFYSLRIDKDRQKLIPQINHLVRNIIRYHPKLLERIWQKFLDEEIKSSNQSEPTGGDISSSINDETEDKVLLEEGDTEPGNLFDVIPKTNAYESKTIDEKLDNTSKKQELDKRKMKKLESILSSLTVTLPEGKIAHHKAIIEDVRAYIDMVNTIVDSVFSTDNIPSGSQVAETYNIFRSLVKTHMIKNYVESTQASEEFEIPAMEDIDPTKLANHILTLDNIKRMVDEAEKVISKPTETESTTSDGGDDYSSY